MNTSINLTPIEALVLQQVNEDIEDDTTILAQQLSMSRNSTTATIAQLRNKGLVAVDATTGSLYVRVTRKGKQLIQYLWPEVTPISQRTF